MVNGPYLINHRPHIGNVVISCGSIATIVTYISKAHSRICTRYGGAPESAEGTVEWAASVDQADNYADSRKTDDWTFEVRSDIGRGRSGIRLNQAGG